MRFLHLSDLHKLDDYTDKGGIYSKVINRMEDPFLQLDRILELVDDRLDAVLISGDICEYGTIQDYRSVRNRLERSFDCPILVCSGNHDRREELSEVFGLNKKQGELFAETTAGPVRFILFDSSDPHHNDGLISEKTCDLLEDALGQKGNKILVTHHHLKQDQFAMPCAQYPERLLRILKENDYLALLTGHTHHIYHGEFCGKPYHTTGSLSFVADEKAGRLTFYQQPSAVLYEFKDSRLSYRDLLLPEGKILDIWEQ